MRIFLTNFYELSHRTAGVYAGLATLGFLVSVPAQISAGRHVFIPIVISLLAIAAAAVLTRPALLNHWIWQRFSRPGAIIDLIPVLLGNALLPLVFVVPCMGLIMALGLSEHLTRQIAILSAAIPFMLFGISWWVGLVLCLWPDPKTRDDGEDDFVQRLSHTLPLLRRHRGA